MTTPKHKIVKRTVKHTFTADEIAKLNVDFGTAFDAVPSAEADLKSATDTHKAKVAEAKSRATRLRCMINAGFEDRDKDLIVVMDFKKGQKFFYLATDLVDDVLPDTVQPVITEPVTDADRQQELLESEAKFEAREEVELFPTAGDDNGTLIVGRLGGKWFTALRVKIGTRIINERLDQEQPCSKKRPDQIKRALKRFAEWLDETLGREEAKGFKNQIELVKAEHAEREE